jgi:hypothetical protein
MADRSLVPPHPDDPGSQCATADDDSIRSGATASFVVRSSIVNPDS